MPAYTTYVRRRGKLRCFLSVLNFTDFYLSLIPGLKYFQKIHAPLDSSLRLTFSVLPEVRIFLCLSKKNQYPTAASTRLLEKKAILCIGRKGDRDQAFKFWGSVKSPGWCVSLNHFCFFFSFLFLLYIGMNRSRGCREVSIGENDCGIISIW